MAWFENIPRLIYRCALEDDDKEGAAEPAKNESTKCITGDLDPSLLAEYSVIRQQDRHLDGGDDAGIT